MGSFNEHVNVGWRATGGNEIGGKYFKAVCLDVDRFRVTVSNLDI